MIRLQPGTVGILPVGALGAGFFFHLTGGLSALDGRVCFLERQGSTRAPAAGETQGLRIACGDAVREIPARAILQPRLLECADARKLPEVLLVCTQPDQLLAVATEYVELLEFLYRISNSQGALHELPILVLCSNGIYHQRVRRFFVEMLEESMLYGRLPDLWNGAMERIVGKFVRGVTMQTGQREGSGSGAVYRPGPPGSTRLCGGDPANRRRCGDVLRGLGGRLEVAEAETPTRIEFDKALVNLCGNLLGLLKAIDNQGGLHLLTVGEIFPHPEDPETRELSRHVVAVGRAVQAYRQDEGFESIYAAAMQVARGPAQHVPSSLKWIELQLRSGTLQPALPPTESWLLDPLIRYARTAGLDESTQYFDDLVRCVIEKLTLAIGASG